MASNSNQRSGSSARSTSRKRVHIDTGVRNRSSETGAHLAGTAEAGRSRGARGSRDGRRGSPPRHESAAARARREQRETKRAEQRRVLRLRGALIAGVLIVVTVLSGAVYRSQLFAIETVDVTGTSTLSVEDVRSRVALPDDATLLRFPRAQIESDLETDPWIAHARVRRRFPSTLTIVIDERVPAALLDTGVTFWFVDGDGRFLGESSLDTTDSPLPVIRDVPGLEPVADQVTEDVTLLNALQVLAGVSPDLRSRVRAVSAASAHETTLITDGSIEVMVGEAVQLTEKSALALGIMAEQGQDVVFIDVRSIDRPISRGLDR